MSTVIEVIEELQNVTFTLTKAIKIRESTHIKDEQIPSLPDREMIRKTIENIELKYKDSDSAELMNAMSSAFEYYTAYYLQNDDQENEGEDEDEYIDKMYKYKEKAIELAQKINKPWVSKNASIDTVNDAIDELQNITATLSEILNTNKAAMYEGLHSKELHKRRNIKTLSFPGEDSIRESIEAIELQYHDSDSAELMYAISRVYGVYWSCYCDFDGDTDTETIVKMVWHRSKALELAERDSIKLIRETSISINADELERISGGLSRVISAKEIAPYESKNVKIPSMPDKEMLRKTIEDFEKNFHDSDSAEFMYQMANVLGNYLACYEQNEANTDYPDKIVEYRIKAFELADEGSEEWITYSVFVSHLQKQEIPGPVQVEALLLLEKIFKLTPGFRPSLFDYCDGLFRAGQFQESADIALELYERSLEINPDWEPSPQCKQSEARAYRGLVRELKKEKSYLLYLQASKKLLLTGMATKNDEKIHEKLQELSE